jgi:hypothetical protein
MQTQALSQPLMMSTGHFSRAMRVLTVVTTGLILLMALAAQSVSAAETRTFTGMKICRTPFVTIAPPSPGGYCLITKASIKSLVGAKAYYTDAHIVLGVLNSPVTIKATDRRRSTITGHCTYYYPPAANPSHGLCVYSGGTGKFEGFNARWVIGSPTATGVTVTGPYWFDRDDHGEENNGDD